MLPTTIFMGGNNLKKPKHWHTNLASYFPFFLLTTHSSLFVFLDREDIKVVLVPGDYCDIGNQREKRNGVYLPKQSCLSERCACVISVRQSVTFSKRSLVAPHGPLSVTNTAALSFTGDL